MAIKKLQKKSSSVTSHLENKDLTHIDQDIRSMSRSELVKHFGTQRTKRVLVTKLIKNLIWQAHELISANKQPAIKGNLRTFWYSWIKPVLARVPGALTAKKDPYDVMTQSFSEMVFDLKLFNYSDFDFTDENWENRRIGTSRPEILVFAEKRGWIRFLLELHEELGVSVLALGGAPSALTSEYTATHIKEALPEQKPIRLIGIVDYDPSGSIIANAFQSQLIAAGLSISELNTVIHPRYYSTEEINIARYPLPKGEKAKQDKWLEQTGGIDGEAYGLESESMPFDRVRTFIFKLLNIPSKSLLPKREQTR
jgi:hypothetical protein